SDPVKAIGYSREALILANSINDQKGMAAAYNNIGVAYRNQGALDVALENYMKSMELYTSIQNGEGVATSKNNIANIYAMKKDYGQALKYLEESHNGFIALGNTEKMIGSMNNLGNLHSDLQLYDQAQNFYSEAWKMSEKTGKPFSDPLINMGNLLFRQGNYQRAVDYYQRALEIVRTQNNRLNELTILANIGEVFTKAAQPVEAQRYLDQAMELSTELNASLAVPQILKSKAANFYRQGKAKEAYETMLKYDEAREKVYGEESTRKIAQMNVALELEAKEKEIDALQVDDKLKTLKLRNTQIIITCIVLAIAAVLAFVNLFVLRKRINVK
ncbi:MAG: tetratricopeptide repeat protein, partial [Cyclobacteriaceae bacterium]|nr:tetratricopeptide repeat protein [Cyclobacteriaceae bacterium]